MLSPLRAFETTPLWGDASRASLAPFPTNHTADVVVIGAGVAGLSAAYRLSLRGLTVAVLEPAGIGAGMTSHSTAHIANAIDDGWHALVKKKGAAQAVRVAAAYAHGIETVAAIQAEEGIACDFARTEGYLVGSANQRVTLEEELYAAHSAGVSADWAEPPFGVGAGAALRFPGQARLHPQKYVNGLAHAIRKRGGEIFRASAMHLEGYTAPLTVITDHGPITARRAVVFAKNVFEDFPGLSLRQETYRSYVIAAQVPKGSARDAVCWDLDDPYHYTRLQPWDALLDVLVAGGEDHPAEKQGHPDAAFAALERWMRERFPKAGPILNAWPGEIKQTADNLGYMGRAADDLDVYLIDGDGGLGFNHATIGAEIISDLIVGAANPWAGIFDPGRFR